MKHSIEYFRRGRKKKRKKGWISMHADKTTIKWAQKKWHPSKELWKMGKKKLFSAFLVLNLNFQPFCYLLFEYFASRRNAGTTDSIFLILCGARFTFRLCVFGAATSTEHINDAGTFSAYRPDWNVNGDECWMLFATRDISFSMN